MMQKSGMNLCIKVIDRNCEDEVISAFEQQVFPLPPFLQEAIVVAFDQTRTLSIGEVRMLLYGVTNQGQIMSHNRASTRISDCEIEINIHIVRETIALIEKARFLEQLARKGHTCRTYGLHFRGRTLFKVPQVIGKQAVPAGYPHVIA